MSVTQPRPIHFRAIETLRISTIVPKQTDERLHIQGIRAIAIG